jgi:hypothetical protein
MMGAPAEPAKFKETLIKRLPGQIAALRGTRNPHVLLVHSGFCVPGALHFIPLARLLSIPLSGVRSISSKTYARGAWVKGFEQK